MSLKGSEIVLFATDEFSGGKSDVTGTEQYSITLNLNVSKGILVDCSFVEISGTSETDSLLLNIYRSINGTWTGNEIEIEQIDCGVAAVGTIKKHSDAIDTAFSAPGFYRIGVVASGGTNPFDVELRGRYW